jgi:nicotinamide N-methyltransferase
LSGQEVLELGAGSGLPGLCIAKRFPTASVTLSDYPDPSILSTLQSNAALNGLGNVKVVGHVWGTSTPTLGKFNLIIAADTLWLSEQHQAFLWSFKTHLIRSEEARVLLIAGLHTGRYTIAKFLKLIAAEGFDAECVAETALSGGEERNWAVERHEEQDSDRRRWVVKIILKWNEF